MNRILLVLALLTPAPAAAQTVIVPGPLPSCTNNDTLLWNAATEKFICAAGAAASQPLSDAFGLIRNATNGTKVLWFDVAAISPSTNRTWTIPDANITIPSTIASLAANTYVGLQTLDGGLSATTGTFSSTLGVTGATTLSATLAVTGATTLSSTLGVTGATTLAGLSATTGSFSSTFNVTGAGPHAIGGATNALYQVLVAGTFSPSGAGTSAALNVSSTVNAVAAENSYGVRIAPTLVEAASGTHAILAGLGLDAPTITDGVGTTTAAATLYVSAAPTGGATNYALWVDAGVSKFDGAVTVDGATTLSSTLGVTGATTLAGLSATTGTFSSTLGVTGNVAVNTNKFTVTAASGNTTIAGTLGVTGATTLAGNVGVGGSAPSFTLDVLKAVATDYVARVANSQATGAIHGLLLKYTGQSPNNTASLFWSAEDGGGSTRAHLRSNGGLANYSANDVNLSDRGAKDLQGPLEPLRTKFAAIRLYRGRYKDSTRTSDDIMWTAQEIAALDPTWTDVFQAEETDAAGKVIKPMLLGTRDNQIFMANVAVTLENMNLLNAVLAVLTRVQCLAAAKIANVNAATLPCAAQ